MSIQAVCFRLISIIALAALLVGPTQLPAQSGLPAGWQTLPPAEFVEVANDWKATTGGTDPETLAAIATHAAQLLTATNVVQTATDYGVLLGLYTWGKSELTQQQAATLAQQLVNREDEPATMPYLQLNSRVSLMELAGVSSQERAAEVAAWLNADQTNCRDVWEGAYPYLYLTLSYPQTREGSVSIVWTGRLTAPQTGDYVFSIGPFNVNDAGPSFYCSNACSISINGEQVLRATPDDWTTESTAVRLTANTPVNIRIEMQFDVSQHLFDTLHATLYWQGPGIARDIIPTQALTTPDGTSDGLLGQYSVVLESGPQVVTRIDPTIDFAWTTGRQVVFEHEAAVKKLLTHLWDACMDPAYLARCEQQAADPWAHRFLDNPCVLAECLSSSQRRAFLNEVLQRPVLLEPRSFTQMWLFFRAFRFGASDEAVDVLGLWSARHPHPAPILPSLPSVDSFYFYNRLPAHDLALCVTWHCADHARRLQEEYLELENGGCSLPIAYTLAYSHLMRGEITQWIELVDSHLEDDALAGDQRVTWLVARAMAEEIRNSPIEHYYAGRLRLTSGEPWLQEAMLVAESPELQLRAAQERLVRVAALQQWDAWNEQLQAAQQRFAGNAGAQAVLTQWQTAAQEAQANIVAEAEQQAIAARQSQLAALRDRLEHAAGRGDVAGQQRLASLISQLEANSNE